jgi:hypothetical protein
MSTVRVYGTLADVVNHPLERARVTVALVAASGFPVELPAIETTIVSPLAQTVESGFSFDLAPQSECDPPDSVYTFKVSVPGAGVTRLQTFVVPGDVSEAWIGDLFIDPIQAGGGGSGGGGGGGPVTLDSLVDVSLTDPADNQVLTYDGYTEQWRNAVGGGLPSRASAAKTTASLAAGASETGTITLAKSYRLLRLSTNRPARVRLYTTAAKRDADAARPIGTDPTGDHGLVLEFASTASMLAADLSPQADGSNLEASPTAAIPISITYLDAGAGTVTATLTYLTTEN